ncbi:T-cell activation Rho GTPase-activating protein-like [Calonectris borealis]
MAAMQKSVKEEKVEELKAVAEKLPAANLLLLKRLLSLLQHIGHNASTSRMSCSNLAICLGPNLLSPASEDLLPLEAMLEVTQKVKVLVEFLIENHCEVFGEETTGLSSPSAEASPAPMDRSTELPLEEQRGPAGDADMEHQAKAFLDTPASLLVLQKAAGADTVAGSETAEAPVALPPSTPQTTADSLGSAEELKGLSEERRFAGSRRDNENQGKRKRQEVWADERECQRAKKRRKTEKDGD